MTGTYEEIIREHRDQLYGGYSVSAEELEGSLRPFYSIDFKNEEFVTKWLEDTLEVLQKEQEGRAWEQLSNMRFYNGIQSLSQQGEGRSVTKDKSRVNKSAKIVLNEMREITTQSVSRITRFPAQINTFPWTNEYSDKIGAKFSKRVVDNLWYQNEIDEIFKDAVFQTKICGESFLFVEWNPHKGDVDKEVAKLEELERYHKQRFTTDEGDTVTLDMIKRIGDVSYSLSTMPWFVFHEPCVHWRDVNYLFRASLKHIDEIRFENKGIAFDKTEPLSMYNSTEPATYGPGFKYGEWVIQYEFWHRRHRFLDKGRYIKFCNGNILVNKDLPYSHGKLPVARFTDIDDLAQAHGISFYSDLKLPQVMYNRMNSLIYRNIAIAGHPKMFVPSGSTNMYSMANGPFVVEYDGPIKPEIASFNTVGAEVFNFAGSIMNKIQQYSGTFGISRGESIPNARANSMLAFYEEQEDQRESVLAAKYRAFQKKTAQLTLGVAGDYYEADDGRMLRILGRNNQYKLRKLEDITLIKKPVDVRIERTTALSESKQGRIDQIATLAAMPLNGEADIGKPGLFTREQILSLIDIADTETFFSMTTASVDKARSENEDLFEAIEISEPQAWEMHLVHWNEHFQFIQSVEFTDTERVPQEVREAVLDHLLTHEMYMYDKARSNATFAKFLLENTYFPAVFEIGTEQPTILQLVMQHETPPPSPAEQAEMDLAQKDQEIAEQEAAAKEESDATTEEGKESPAEEPQEEDVEVEDDEISEEDIIEIVEETAQEVAASIVEAQEARNYTIEKSVDEAGNTIARIIYDDGMEKIVTINHSGESSKVDVSIV